MDTEITIGDGKLVLLLASICCISNTQQYCRAIWTRSAHDLAHPIPGGLAVCSARRSYIIQRSPLTLQRFPRHINQYWLQVNLDWRITAKAPVTIGAGSSYCAYFGGNCIGRLQRNRLPSPPRHRYRGSHLPELYTPHSTSQRTVIDMVGYMQTAKGGALSSSDPDSESSFSWRQLFQPKRQETKTSVEKRRRSYTPRYAERDGLMSMPLELNDRKNHCTAKDSTASDAATRTRHMSIGVVSHAELHRRHIGSVPSLGRYITKQELVAAINLNDSAPTDRRGAPAVLPPSSSSDWSDEQGVEAGYVGRKTTAHDSLLVSLTEALQRLKDNLDRDEAEDEDEDEDEDGISPLQGKRLSSSTQSSTRASSVSSAVWSTGVGSRHGSIATTATSGTPLTPVKSDCAIDWVSW